MPCVVQKNVLGLQIPVDNIKLMQVLQREKQLRAVEAAPLFVETLLALQVVEQFTTVDEPITLLVTRSVRI